MGIDTITAKIASDAAEYASELISEATQKAEEILEEAEHEADGILKRMAEQGAKDAVTTRHRKHSAAELEARKMRLAVKQKAVARAMEAAIDHLANMKPEAYIEFLAKKITETGVKEGQLILNAKDKAALGEKLVKAANKSLQDGKLALSEQTADAKGGFILKYGDLEINSSLETMINSAKEDVTPEVVAVLFEQPE